MEDEAISIVEKEMIKVEREWNEIRRAVEEERIEGRGDVEKQVRRASCLCCDL